MSVALAKNKLRPPAFSGVIFIPRAYARGIAWVE